MTGHHVFIFCGDPSHPRTVAVTNFVADSEGRWRERYASAATQGLRESGVTLIEDEVPQYPLGYVMGRRARGEREARSRYRLECRRCGGRGAVVAREENLFAVFTRLADAGLERVSLAMIAASLEAQSEARRADTEPEQG